MVWHYEWHINNRIRNETVLEQHDADQFIVIEYVQGSLVTDIDIESNESAKIVTISWVKATEGTLQTWRVKRIIDILGADNEEKR